MVVRVQDAVPIERLAESVRQILAFDHFVTDAPIFLRDVPLWEGRDPQPVLEARGDVQRIAPGLFAFSGQFLRVRQALDAVVQDITARRAAREMAYPPLWPVPMLTAIDYFHDFPQLSLLVAGVAPDFQARATFADRNRKTAGRNTISCTAENGIGQAAHALAPTICDCCYWLLRGRRDVADQVLTVHGNVFRNETSEDGRLDRLTAFTMREIVMIGRKDFVLAQRAALVNEIELLLTQLDLKSSIVSADDPFFCNEALYKGAYQGGYRLKYEAHAALYGGRSTAIASINLHKDYFSRSYDFSGPDGAAIYSACVGFGYERMAYALFCRHGAEIANWPQPVRAKLGL